MTQIDSPTDSRARIWRPLSKEWSIAVRLNFNDFWVAALPPVLSDVVGRGRQGGKR